MELRQAPVENLGLDDRLLRLRFGYFPYVPGGRSPGDRRRFPAVADKLGLDWEFYRPGQDYDVIYLTSNADLPHFRHLGAGGPKLGFDMVDSYLSVPIWEPKSLIRGLGKRLIGAHSHLELSFKQTLEGMCHRADLVVCSTPEQQDVISRHSSNVHPILDLHEELLSVPSRPLAEPPEFHLFWEGIGLTTSQFSAIGPVLAELAQEFPLRLHLVTDLKYRAINLPLLPPLETRRLVEKSLGRQVKFHFYEWNPLAVKGISSQCHLGLIPICLDKPLYMDKPENKLLIMWRLGLPVITSATPAYHRTMGAYGGPFWACDSQEAWYRTLREALSNASARQEAAEQGHRYAETDFGTEALLKKWVSALNTLVQ